MDRYYVRRFLNRRGHHAGAYVHARVQRSPKNPKPGYVSDVFLEIADCSRRVSFEFPLHREGSRANSLRKARLLADVLRDFADALEVEAALAAERPHHEGDWDHFMMD